MKIFTATLDTAARILTVIVFIVIAIPIYEAYSNWDTVPTIAMVIMAVVFIIVFPVCYALSVKHFKVDVDKLIICKHFGLVSQIRFDEIASAEILKKDEMGGSVRLFGSGGFFGYFGKYRNRKLGTFTMYATNMNNLILLVLKNGKKVVISPDDAEEFHQLISEKIRN